ncbi:MAG: Holliday junction resolvase RuvX [Nitrospira sp.]|nr:Holliday junction resolvase RuvX [Nitrospira sp.]MBH0182127.1 Holliday junction resolvase RuvX [Nitrospira sp.]MBH0184291.1 Holliday junction resolvase RuvX [Nitrospira sp.]
MPGRILALDYGTKRIGVALSDELGWTAQPLETFERRTLDRDIAHIAALVGSHSVERVVLGLPLQLDGREGLAVQAMRAFVVKLEAGLSVPVVLWDERMTTKAAEDLLIAADVSRKKRKGVIDRIAAAILLQSYLAAQTPVAANPVTHSQDEHDEDVESLEWRSHEAANPSDSGPRRRRARRTGRVSDDSMD